MCGSAVLGLGGIPVAMIAAMDPRFRGPLHPRPAAQVTVTVGRYTTVTLRFDSGIG